MARGTSQDVIRAERKLRAEKSELLRALRGFLQRAYAGNSVTLAEFGLEPARLRGPPPNEVLLRAAKAKSTRQERRTMGKRQKAAIKGDVTGVVPEARQAKGETRLPVSSRRKMAGTSSPFS